MTQENEIPHDPQDAPHRRVFIIRPRPAYHEAAGVSSDHPSCEPVVIVTPCLSYETWFEGWQVAWRKKAKQDFLGGFLDLWSTAFHFDEGWMVGRVFISQLRETAVTETVFDRWWTLEEHRDVREIDAGWRPS